MHLLICSMFAILLTGCSADNAESELNARLDILLSDDAINHDDVVFINSVLAAQPANQAHAGFLLGWGLNHPAQFAEIVARLGAEQINFLADVALDEQKGFLLIERLTEHQPNSSRLIERLRELEGRDLRERVPRYQMKMDSALRGIAKIKGRDDTQTWEGAAILIMESHCGLAFLSAGHTVKRDTDQQKRNTAKAAVSIHFDDQVFTPRRIIVPDSVSEPENDWALTTVAKPQCGEQYRQWLPELLWFADGKQMAVDAQFFCQHRRTNDAAAGLYREACRLHTSESGVLDLYAGKPPGLIGVHHCISDPGSSGCPMFYESEERLKLLGIQIERDRVTDAGIIRLMGGDLQQALDQLATEFSAEPH